MSNALFQEGSEWVAEGAIERKTDREFSKRTAVQLTFLASDMGYPLFCSLSLALK